MTDIETKAKDVAQHITEGIYDVPAIETRDEFTAAVAQAVAQALREHGTALMEATAVVVRQEVADRCRQAHVLGLEEAARLVCDTDCSTYWNDSPVHDCAAVPILARIAQFRGEGKGER